MPKPDDVPVQDPPVEKPALSENTPKEQKKCCKNGPAVWRVQAPTNGIIGLARRKGENRPWKWGLEIEEAYLTHPKVLAMGELPLLKRDEPKKEKKGKEKAVVGDGGGKKNGPGCQVAINCVVM